MQQHIMSSFTTSALALLLVTISILLTSTTARPYPASLSNISRRSVTSTSNSSIQPTNPVKLVQPASFIGNITSSNTGDIRDLGYSGRIGNITILTFGDTIPCQSYQNGCRGLTAPNSAAIITPNDTPSTYTDFRLGPAGKHAQIFCPLLKEAGEKAADGLGLTNVIETAENEGIVFFLRNQRGSQGAGILGAGVAKVTIDPSNSSNITCTRSSAPDQVQFWGANEPYFGDHGAILAADGYVYAYGGAHGVNNSLFLTRVPQEQAQELAAYEYWNGAAFTSERLYNPTVEQAVFSSGQGSILYSKLYQQYLYFKPSCPGATCINVITSERPEGPWSIGKTIWGSGQSPDHLMMYAPVVQTRWTSDDGSSLTLMYTGRKKGAGNILQGIQLDFTL